MMREILFRGKRIDNGEWVFGYLISNLAILVDYDTMKTFQGQSYNCELLAEKYLVDINSTGQFTGLLDKDGNKIFEGDLLNYETDENNKTYTVVFEHGSFVSVSYINNGHAKTKRTVAGSSIPTIIGNIHD